MSNPEKTKVDDTEEEKEEDSDEQWSDEESAMREIVLGLPALRISSERVGVSSVVEEEGEAEARLNEQAVVAAELVMAVAEEAVMKGKSHEGGSGGKKKCKPRKTISINEEMGVLDKGEAKKAKKRSELNNPPTGPPVCSICGKGFGSWKAVFGHLRIHKDRNYQGFLPPPTFSAAAERFTIPGPNSAFVLVPARGGSSVGVAGGVGSSGGFAGSGGGGSAPGGEGGSGLGIDLNVDPVEEVEETTETESIAKFDLNKSPPKDEEEHDKSK